MTRGFNTFTVLLARLFLLVTVQAAVTAQMPKDIAPRDSGVTIIQGNDDGWGAAYIRAFYSVLKGAGYTTAISAPANNKSGSGSSDTTPVPLESASDYDLLPAGAPALGSDPSDDHINYVNAYPVTGVKYGINTTAPALFGAKPQIVLTGINHGTNLGIDTLFSGTIGAANEAIGQGIPAIAFSAPGDERSYLTLTSDDVAYTYADVSLRLLEAVISSGTPYLPPSLGLNVNYNDGTNCQASDYIFVLSRVNVDLNPFGSDVEQCNSTHLPTETDVGKGGPCRASISVFGQGTKLDVSKAQQQLVRDKLSTIWSCV